LSYLTATEGIEKVYHPAHKNYFDAVLYEVTILY